MLNKLVQWLILRDNKEVNVTELEPCPACRGQAVYMDVLLKNSWWRRLFKLTRHKPQRIQCQECSIMLECSGLRKEYAYLLWNRRVEMPESEVARLNSVIGERDNLKSLVAQLQVQVVGLRDDYERRDRDAKALQTMLDAASNKSLKNL